MSTASRRWLLAAVPLVAAAAGSALLLAPEADELSSADVAGTRECLADLGWRGGVARS
jgi:hypothetical protein